jgi:3alpha(or 20beta)-hydroxysteroid dehydrogenase
MPGRFDGRTALISGGARGMGASHARGFCDEGANVIIADVLDDAGQELADELGKAARFVHLDVTSLDDWTRAVAFAEETYGPLAVLVNNAGVGGGGQLVDIELDEWRRVLSVNLDGCFLGIKAVVPSMRRNGGGAIANISSLAGLVGTPLSGPYTTSKFALRGLTKVAALELGREGIRVNSVHPGYIETPILMGLTAEQAGVDLKLALPRMAQPNEVTRMVLFICSDEASYSTGAEFVVDGGWSAGAPISIGSNKPGVTLADLG